MNPNQPVQINPNEPYVLILSGAELALAHEGLGELPAKRSQALRDNLIGQAQRQPDVFNGVQQIAAQRAEASKSQTPTATENPSETQPEAPPAEEPGQAPEKVTSIKRGKNAKA
jgi:hypothetical protein